jgi:hypothetical protein
VSHVVESAASQRHRRNRRTAIILVVLVVVLAGAFYYAASYFNRPASPSASNCPTSDFTAGAGAAAGLTASQVTVNVYNATNRAGLAASTAKDVKARGFTIGNVANDPLKKSVGGAGELRYGPNGQAGAALLSPMIPGVNFILDTRADATVDFVIGNGFTQLGASGTATSAAANPC